MSDDEYDITGDLTIHGTTKLATFRNTFGGLGRDHFGAERAGFLCKTLVHRSDFGFVLQHSSGVWRRRRGG
ncbi:YceI family protein [Neobacillus pocheonensis]|uniref:YceI family protein n=1 Tax=Neobacillus pocheonensis TaxID=363869 RepID=A0ABT0WF78_9BACI|nr:YceI family protein [Neobacillus pocheonensis]